MIKDSRAIAFWQAVWMEMARQAEHTTGPALDTVTLAADMALRRFAVRFYDAAEQAEIAQTLDGLGGE